jgi:DNA-binding transcriptional LysR family regulator
VPDLESKIACHRRGRAVGCLPRSAARELVRLHQLVERPVAVGRPPSPMDASLALQRRRQDPHTCANFVFPRDAICCHCLLA